MRHILPAILTASALTAPARSAPIALPADTPAAQCEALTPLVDWVENGKAPRRTRPAFPYPAYAKYKGKGDPNAAESFRRAE